MSIAVRLAALPAVLLALSGLAFARPAAQEPGAEATETAQLVLWNRPVADFRVAVEGRGPRERAERAVTRIRAVPAENGAWRVDAREAVIDGVAGWVFAINGEFAFRLLEGDVDGEAGETLEQAARAAEERLREALEARVQQRRWPVLLRGIALALGVTIAFVLALVGVSRARARMIARIDVRVTELRKRAVVAGVHVWPVLGGLRQVLSRLLNWSVLGALAYVWLTLVLEAFPYTKPWGDALGGFLLAILARFGWGVLRALPDLFVVILIGSLTHAFNRGVGAYFLAIERGEASVSWLTTETARATRQILALGTWAFALVLAYPYIPGSESAAFKGVSVFVGLVVSLGSAGLVNHLMSGLTVIYSRAFRQGDFVRIGEQEGRVRSLGLLATTLVGPGGLEFAIPNAVVTSNTIRNYSRSGGGAGELLATSVTIGYDAPWRQVHGLLLLAAERTALLAREPAPFVLQRALSDFYVEYQLHGHLAPDAGRPEALSALHGAIQDAFNEHGVQILSPHFESQPAAPVVVPREAWHTAPARG